MYDREAMRARIRDMLRDAGIDVPDKLPEYEIILQDKNGHVLKRRKMGEAEKKDDE